VLEDRERGLGAMQERIARACEIVSLECRNDLAIGFRRELLHRVARRPLMTMTARGVVLRGIDASCEQCLERRIDARTAERAFHERVEAEGGKMPFVEDDRMAQIDRARVVRLIRHEIEQRLSPGAVARVPFREACGVRHT